MWNFLDCEALGSITLTLLQAYTLPSFNSSIRRKRAWAQVRWTVFIIQDVKYLSNTPPTFGLEPSPRLSSTTKGSNFSSYTPHDAHFGISGGRSRHSWHGYIFSSLACADLSIFHESMGQPSSLCKISTLRPIAMTHPV